jgi:hypothetical protein
LGTVVGAAVGSVASRALAPRALAPRASISILIGHCFGSLRGEANRAIAAAVAGVVVASSR